MYILDNQTFCFTQVDADGGKNLYAFSPEKRNFWDQYSIS